MHKDMLWMSGIFVDIHQTSIRQTCAIWETQKSMELTANAFRLFLLEQLIHLPCVASLFAIQSIAFDSLLAPFIISLCHDKYTVTQISVIVLKTNAKQKNIIGI